MTFSQPLTAGETILQDVHSEGFESGVTGWEIQRDGDAEFNDADIRGTLDVVGSDPDARIRLIVNGGTPVMQITDSAGNIYEFKASTTASMSIRPTTAPNSGLHFVRGEGIVLRSDATGAPSVLFDDDDGFLKRGSFSPWTEETWVNVTVNSGSASVGNEPQVKLLPDGTCVMRGLITGHSTVANALIATLPAGYRPARVGRWVGATESTADNNHVSIGTNGEIRIQKAAANNTWFNNVLLSTI